MSEENKAPEVSEEVEGQEPPVQEPPAQEEPPAEEPPAKKAEGKKPLDPKKIEEDVSNMAHFKEGEEVELKGLKMVIKEVSGIGLVLKRKDLV